MRKNLMTRIGAVLLCAVMLTGQVQYLVTIYAKNNSTSYGDGLCEHHTEHDEDCGYAEGSPCTHIHTDECYVMVETCSHVHTSSCYADSDDEDEDTATSSNAKGREPIECSHVCSEEEGCVTWKLDCHHEHDETCGYVEGSPCSYVCEICQEDGELTDATPSDATSSNAVLSGGAAGTVSGNAIQKSEPTEKIITAWNWAGSADELEIQQDEETGVWGLGLPGVTIDNQADFDTVVSMLPTAITATVTVTGSGITADESAEQSSEEITDAEDETEREVIEELSITWSCEEYVKDETGNWPVSGDYTFQADLPEGYTLAEGQEKLEVVLQLGEVVPYANKNAGDFNVTGDGTATTERIIVSGNDITTTITLNNVNIDASATNNTQAFLAKDINQTNVKLIIVLQETNTLKSGIIWNNTDNNSSLEIQGNGSLMATGGYCAAAIGGNRQPASNITISGGVVTATGGYGGAGIGGGYQKSGTNITISGGTVTATGVNGGAGIGGGGAGGAGSNIIINGGTVTATSGMNGAGIGGGSSGEASDITINDGTVIATCNSGAGAGIGGGNRASGTNITINGGTVIATGNRGGAGIGGGYAKNGTNITINGGTVTATGEVAGIGGGTGGGSASNIKINGGSVKAGSIGVTPTDDSKNNVYLAKLENLSGTNSVSVNGKTYTRNGDHPDDGAFYLYLIGGKDYEITVSNIKYSVKWNGSDAFTVQQTSPTPTISDVSGTANSITVSLSGYDTKYGYAQYACIKTGSTLSESDWKSVTDSSYTFIDREPETPYTCYVRFAGSGNYLISEVASKEFTTNAIIQYMDAVVTENGQVTMEPKSSYSYIALAENTSGAVTLGTAGTTTWYAVTNSVTFGKRMTIEGDVHLILKDGCKLTAPGGITVNDQPTSLTIYGQSGGTGTLIAGEATTTGRSGIGGGDTKGGGNITINGGIVTAIGGSDGAGIGSGNRREKGRKTTAVITINGGTVTASAGQNSANTPPYHMNAAGIGGGCYASSGMITINGGTVTATGGRRGAAIGSGWYGDVDTITINGGTITANTCGGGGVSIGHGNNDGYGNGGTIFINSDANITMQDLSNDTTWDWNVIETTSGVVYTDKIGVFNGKSLIADLTVPEGYTLTVPEGSSLAIPSGKTLTNNGTIANRGTITNSGTITKGTLTNRGTISYPVTLAGDDGISGFQTSKNGTDYAAPASSLTADYKTGLYVKAIPASGHGFSKWSDGSTSAVYQISEDNYNPVSLTASSSTISYTITIPSSVTAGGEAVSITASNLNLGTGGAVHVKANYGTDYDISSAGLLTLKRKDATDTITSQMYLDGSEFKDLTKDVAVFSNSSNVPVSVKFGTPSHEGTIPAGDYSGTVIFQFTYEQQ